MIAGVVVTHSAPPELLHRCLASVLRTPELGHVIVVDNGGAATVPDDDRVELVRVANDGYGAAANAGFRRAAELGATAFVLLNDDVFVRDGWLAPLAAELDDDHGRVGAVQPKLVYADTEPTTVNSLGVAVDRYGAGSDIGDGQHDAGPDIGPDIGVATREIDVFTGGAVLLSAEFVEATGGFDERYFLYYEDVDLARRGARLGWRYRCVPASVVDHVGSVTTDSMPDRTRYLQERNRLWCAFAHADAATIARAVWLSVRRLRWSPRRVHARALAAGLAGAPTRVWRRRVR